MEEPTGRPLKRVRLPHSKAIPHDRADPTPPPCNGRPRGRRRASGAPLRLRLAVRRGAPAPEPPFAATTLASSKGQEPFHKNTLRAPERDGGSARRNARANMRCHSAIARHLRTCIFGDAATMRASVQLRHLTLQNIWSTRNNASPGHHSDASPGHH